MPNQGIGRGSLPSGALIGVHFADEAMMRHVRDLRGRFTSQIQGALTRAHLQMAKQAQEEIRGMLQKRIDATGRPQRSAQELLGAVEDKALSVVKVSGWAIDGNKLNEIAAVKPYWQRLEEGELVRPGGMLGRWVYPFWQRGEGMAGLRGASASPDRGSGNYRKDLFMPHKRATAGAPGAIQITHPVPSYHFLRDGFQAYVDRGPIKQIYLDKLREVGIHAR